VAQTTTSWEKTGGTPTTARAGQSGRFLIGGVLVLIAIAFLIGYGTLNNAQYFITVDELLARPELAGKTVRISGAVIGDTISYEASTLTIRFTIVHIPAQMDNLALALHQAVGDPAATRLNVVVENEPMPDLLQNEAQAILTGKLGEDGIFYADELLLKCPTRYEEAVPEQAQEASTGQG